jgi:hypothetical protein
VPLQPAHFPRPHVLHNSRLVCWGTIFVGICSVFIGICMMFIVISVLTPWSALSFMRVLAAVQWGLGGVAMCAMCPALWKWGRGMLHKKVRLDEHGADFSLGTSKDPCHVFLRWDLIESIVQKRVGGAQQFTVTASDGSYAQFTSYTFFRPRHVARLIAERAGKAIQSA